MRDLRIRPRPRQSMIESHDVVMPRVADPSRTNPDIRNLALLRAAPHSHEEAVEPAHLYRHIIRPGRVRHTDWGLILPQNDWIQVIPQNDHRRRLILVNDPGQAVSDTIYWALGGPSAYSRVPLAPGAIWDESGSEVADDPIFAFCASAGVIIGAWEGIPLDRYRDEFRDEGLHK